MTGCYKNTECNAMCAFCTVKLEYLCVYVRVHEAL